MEAIDQIKNDDIGKLRQAAAHLKRELHETIAAIPKLKQALDGQGETPEAIYDSEKTERVLKEKRARISELRREIAACEEGLSLFFCLVMEHLMCAYAK